MIHPDTIEKAKKLLDLLRAARELRSHLKVNPRQVLQLFALDKDETLNCETNVSDELRITLLDFLVERLEKCLGDLDVAIP